MMILEVCCYSVECALTAQNAGADRIELCSSPSEGGITPSYGALLAAQEMLTIPVHPIIRPRGGDFCYSELERKVMKNDIAKVRDMGFAGIVIGILESDGNINLQHMRELLALSGNMAVTFHRAFDMCRDPMLALAELTQLGVARILTSGQQKNAEQGLPLLQKMTKMSQGPIIMAGAGVRLINIDKFINSGIQELHSSCGSLTSSKMQYRKSNITMGSDEICAEYQIYRVDSAIVSAMKDKLKAAHSLINN